MKTLIVNIACAIVAIPILILVIIRAGFLADWIYEPFAALERWEMKP